MYPEILDLGPLHIRAFGLMLALAFLAGTVLAMREGRRQGLDETRIVNLILVILFSSLVGARAFYVLTHLAEFQGRWGNVWHLWEGGLTLYGGLAAGTAAGFAWMYATGMPRGVTADVLAPSFALGAGIARLGCFLNGCCFGVECDLPWGVHFPPGSPPDQQFPGAAVHPSQLYNALAGFALFALVWALRGRLKAPGQLWWLLVVLFALVRIPIDATRYYEPSAYVIRWAGGGLTDSELVGIGLAILGTVLFVLAGRSQRSPVERTAPGRARP